MDNKRVFIIVLDSLGIGELPDAEAFGDASSNTLRAIAASKKFNTPNLSKLGLFNIDGVQGKEKTGNPIGSFARMAEKSAGKDTTIGHWEISGIISQSPMPTFPNGFPAEVINKFEALTGRHAVCNKPYSGTEVIMKYGQEHEKTGDLIVYTSADSVFQIAAHESVVPVEQLYEYCRLAREMLTGDYAVGRVIARPFTGSFPNYSRTTNRHDFSLEPSRDTMLNILSEKGFDTIGVGKIGDIFAGSGISKSFSTNGNTDGMNRTFNILKQDFNGLCFVNLVDFDMLYGHRNDIDGYAAAVSEFDNWLSEFLPAMRNNDVLIITADHGCDPSTPSTNHSREYIPMIIYGNNIRKGFNLSTRSTFADIGATILDIFGIYGKINGTSFKCDVLIEK